MAVFGRFEVVQELSRFPFGSVYSARPVGTREEPRYVVKTFRPALITADDLDTGEAAPQPLPVGTDPESQGFLAQARLQQKVAAAGRHWAPIHDVGISPEGAYYVSLLYPSSGQRLIRGRVKLDAAALHALLTAVVQGLSELRDAAQQPHGNIKPATVLLPRRDEQGYGEAVLVEPLTPDEARRAGEAADLAGVGDLIYQLVMHRAPGLISGGINATPEWRRLGRKESAWRDLCTRLLDPGQRQQMTLEKLRQDLALLKPARRILPVKSLAAALVLVVLLGVAYGAWRYWERQKPSENWAALCDLYPRRVKLFADANFQAVHALLDDYLRRNVLEPVREQDDKNGKSKLDPTTVAGELAGGVKLEDYKTLKPPGGKVDDAYAVVLKATEAFDRWPALLSVRDKGHEVFARSPELLRQREDWAGTLERWSWSGAAAHLRDLGAKIDAARDAKELSDPLQKLLKAQTQMRAVLADVGAVEKSLGALEADPLTRDLAVQIRASLAIQNAAGTDSLDAIANRLAEVRPLAEGIEQRWSAVGPRVASITADDDPVLRRFGEYARSAIYDRAETGEPLPRLRQVLANLTDGELGTGFKPGGAWENLAALVAGDWKKPDAFNKQVFASRETAVYDRNRKADRSLFIDWAASAARYRLLAASRPAVDDRAEETAARLKELEPLLRDKVVSAEDVNTARDRLARLNQQRRQVEDIPWLSGFEQQVRDQTASLNTAYGDLVKDLEALIRVPDDRIAELVTLINARPFKVDVLNDAWAARRAQWLSDRDQFSQRPKFNARKVEVELARRRLETLGSLFAREPKLTVPAPDSWQAKLQAILAEKARQQAAAALAQAIAAAKWADISVDDAAFAASCAALARGFGDWIESGEKFAQDLAAIETALDGGYGIAPEPDGKPSPVAALLDPVQKHPFWSDALIVEQIAAIQLRLKRISEVAGMTQPAELVAQAKGSDLSAALAAWRALHKQPKVWPGGAADLATEREMLAALNKLLDARKAQVGDRLQVLRKELTDDAAGAWRRVMESAADARSVAAALSAKRDFLGDADPLSLNPPLTAAARFNIRLHRFQQEAASLQPEKDDAAIAQKVRELEASLDEQTRSRQQVAQLLKRLNEAAKKDDDAVIVKAGPETSPLAARTAVTVDDRQPGLLVYRFLNHELKFVELKDVSGRRGAPSYLCATEVSIGLMRDVMGAAGETVDTMGLPRQLSPASPVAWSVVGDVIDVPADQRWYRPFTELFDHYPDALKGLALPGETVSRSLKGNDPTLGHPMHFVPPAAAIYLSHLVGCRLPTVDEWNAARALDKSANPNLRDQTVLDQMAHIAALKNAQKRLAPLVDTAANFRPPGDPVFDGPEPWDLASLAQAGVAVSGVGTYQDGALWPVPVQGEGVFSHLVGNVAELVTVDVDAFEPLRGRKPAEIRKQLEEKETASRLRVIGASALSARRWGLGPQPVNLAGSLGKTGCTDVGFRLAFTAPRVSPVVRVRNILDGENCYLASVP